MRTANEVREWLNTHIIAGRYHRREIRQYLIDNYPKEDFIFNTGQLGRSGTNEVTCTDFKNFIDEKLGL